MEKNELNRVFDQVKLSPEREEAMLADLLSEKKEVSSMKQTNSRHGIRLAVLVAAALVVVLAGTAVGVGYFGRLEVSPIGGDYENGYEVTGAFENVPVELLSEEVRARAAEMHKGSEDLTFGSWSEAEAYLGLEIASNPMLEEMANSEWTPLHECDAKPEDLQYCDVHMVYSLDQPSQIMLHADYFGDYFAEGPFGVNVFAALRVKAPGQEDVPFTFGMKNIKNVSEEKYVTPSGMEVTIITRDAPMRSMDGTTFQQSSYIAHFALNNAVFVVCTNFGEETADSALHLLKQVLDAYE